MTLHFTVEGVPVPKGSMKFVGMFKGKPRLVPTGGWRLTKWERAVHKAAQEATKPPVARGWPVPSNWDVGLRIIFFLDNRRNNDIDKLMRAVLDALTGVIYPDDKQVTRVEATKRYAPAMAGAEIWVEVSDTVL